MNANEDKLVKLAYATPQLRANIVNSGMITLYCDYSGDAEANTHGVACCRVHNRTIKVSAKKLQMDKDRGSDYGELLAIEYSLGVLEEALSDHQADTSPKLAVIYTDCHCIKRILSKETSVNKSYETIKKAVVASIDDLCNKFPDIRVTITHLRNYRKINALHRMAHNAARSVIGK